MPYMDSPQPIGHDATISAPHMHAHATESLLKHILPSDRNPAPRVLDIGSGSGYLTHVLAELVGDRGLVVGLEHIPELKELGEKNMAKSEEGKSMLASGKVRFRVGDGRKGWDEPPREGEGGEGDVADRGWDAIHVGAAAVKLHQELVDQLRSPGRYVFFSVSYYLRLANPLAPAGCSFPSRMIMALVINTSGVSIRRRMGLLSRRGCLGCAMCP